MKGMVTMLSLTTLMAFFATGTMAQGTDVASNWDKMIGLYVHQHWPYNHPYAARTWTLEDWRGFLEGIHLLGYNTVKIWPVLETMPKPLTESDRANLEKIGKVIDIAHHDFDMRVVIALCPNVVADNASASQATFEDRHFFHCDIRVNPGDADAMTAMLAWRKELLRPLAAADAIAIIDSDPGGYPGSTNQEFVDLLGAHRRLFDSLRPGIQLLYWAHAGWEGYARFYETGKFEMGKKSEFLDTYKRLKALNPEPWALANGRYAEEAGVEDRIVAYNYGCIEGEPSFPLTNFGGNQAHDGGAAMGPLGVMGNAQTHCVQLPNIFAFARGATGRPLEMDDYRDFAEKLIPGEGEAILAAWCLIGKPDPGPMHEMAEKLEAKAKQPLQEGPLKGLLFGNPERFLMDLVYQLRFLAAKTEFCNAVESDKGFQRAFRAFAQAAEAWQQRHGYENAWYLGHELAEALGKVGSPEIDAVFNPTILAKTPYGQVRERYYITESQTVRLIEAMMKAAAADIDRQAE